jgi:hypothetical protein
VTVRRIALAAAIAVCTLGWWTGLRDQVNGPPTPRRPATIQEWHTIAAGENAIAAAQAYVQQDLSAVGQPVPDYGNAPGCTPYGCVAQLP